MTKPTGGDYLWKTIQANKLIKLGIVSRMLGILEIRRPDLSICDTGDTSSILSFIARENLDCAFHCEPDTEWLRVEELCKIALWKYEKGFHPHIILHPNADKAIGEKSAHDMLPYFEVFLRETVQEKEEQEKLLIRFKEFFIRVNIW